MEKKYDLIVIGSGPGGYTGAIRAAQLGFKVAIVEKEKTLGGTCLNIGCIPSKALLDSSEHFSMAKEGDFFEHGLEFSDVKIDVARMMARKTKIVKNLTSGVTFLMKKNKIDRIQGKASLRSPETVLIQDQNGEENILKASSILLATGSEPVSLSFAPFDEKVIVSSKEALSFKKVPESLIIVGGGYIGLELGSVWSRLGAKVSVVEAAPMICGTMDQEVASSLLKILRSQGFEFFLETSVKSILAKGDGAEVQIKSSDGEKTLFAEKVLVAVGRKPYTDGLNLEGIGIEQNQRGRVKVNETYQTSVPSVYAIGDLIDGPMLAHKAEEEGVAVAEYLKTGYCHVNYDALPGVIYTWPEVASVGKTEEELKESGRGYNVGRFPFKANGRAMALGFTDGYVKMLADKETDEILGVHIIGPRASDMIAELVVAMEFQASSEDVGRTFHAHPTLAEVVREAALAVDGRMRQS